MKKTKIVAMIVILMSFGVLFIWLSYHKPPNTEVVINLTDDQTLPLNNTPKTEQLDHFNSKILGISFDYMSNWSNKGESVNEPDLKTSYRYWVSGLNSELRFETISKDITPFGYEGPETFKFTTKDTEQLCDTLDFVNIKNLENPKVYCQLQVNYNNIPYIRYKISFHFSYESGMDFIIDGVLFKTKSEAFPLLAIYYQRQPDYTDANKYAEALKALDVVISNFSYN